MNIRKLINNMFVILSIIIVFSTCNSGKREQGEKLSFASQVKLKQYTVNGFVLYTNLCSNCHQKDGSGLRNLFPPLKQADYLKDNPKKVICIIKHGVNGPIVVNGTEYNLPMPANEKLTDLEVAELMTYIYSTFVSENTLYETDQVKAALEACN